MIVRVAKLVVHTTYYLRVVASRPTVDDSCFPHWFEMATFILRKPVLQLAGESMKCTQQFSFLLPLGYNLASFGLGICVGARSSDSDITKYTFAPRQDVS